MNVTLILEAALGALRFAKSAVAMVREVDPTIDMADTLAALTRIEAVLFDYAQAEARARRLGLDV